MSSLVFLPSNTQQRSKKDQEVIQAFARSHAAKVGRPKRVKKNQSFAWTPPSTRSATPERLEDENAIVLPTSQPVLCVHTVLQKGNSDPFGTFATPVTPRVADMLLFYATKMLPIRYSSAMVPSSSQRAIVDFRSVEASDDYHSTVAVLHDQGSTVGFFLAQMTVMADLSKSPDMIRQRMQLKGQALKELHSHIRQVDKIDNVVIESVLLLLNAAVYAGDLPEARTHLVFLKSALEQKAHIHGPRSIGIVMLFRVLYMDLAVSATYTTLTILDVNKWVPEMLSVALQQTKQSPSFRPPPIAGFLSNIDTTIDEPLLIMFFECRRLLWVWWTQPANAVLVSGPDVFTIDTHPETYTFRWLYSQLYIYSCRLANYITSFQTAIPDPETIERSSASPGTRLLADYTQHMLALALLTLLSASCTKVLVAGEPLKPGSALMLERLELAMRPLMASTKLISRMALARPFLWAAFIGAAVERMSTQGAVKSTYDSSDISFADCFILLVKEMQLMNKESVTALLELFIYNEHILPGPATWNRAFTPQAGAMA